MGFSVFKILSGADNRAHLHRQDIQLLGGGQMVFPKQLAAERLMVERGIRHMIPFWRGNWCGHALRTIRRSFFVISVSRRRRGRCIAS